MNDIDTIKNLVSHGYQLSASDARALLANRDEWKKACDEAEKRLNTAWITGHHNRELRFALTLAKDAILQAINSEDGLDGSDGEALIKIMDEKMAMRPVEAEAKANAALKVCEVVCGFKNIGNGDLLDAVMAFKATQKGEE